MRGIAGCVAGGTIADTMRLNILVVLEQTFTPLITLLFKVLIFILFSYDEFK
jgi:hypothetical protein